MLLKVCIYDRLLEASVSGHMYIFFREHWFRKNNNCLDARLSLLLRCLQAFDSETTVVEVKETIHDNYNSLMTANVETNHMTV